MPSRRTGQSRGIVVRDRRAVSVFLTIRPRNSSRDVSAVPHFDRTTSSAGRGPDEREERSRGDPNRSDGRSIRGFAGWFDAGTKRRSLSDRSALAVLILTLNYMKSATRSNRDQISYCYLEMIRFDLDRLSPLTTIVFLVLLFTKV